MKQWLLLLVWIGLYHQLFSQQPAFQIINQNSGLSSNTIYDLLQDSKGYIWIAGEKGLSRFDGVNFIQYSNSNENSKSLSNVIEYLPGEVYVQNFSGQIFRTSHDSLIYVSDLSKTGNYFQMQKMGNTLISFGYSGIYSTILPFGPITFTPTPIAIFENTWIEKDKLVFLTENGELKQFKNNKIESLFQLDPLKDRFNRIVKCKKGYLFLQKNNNSLVYLFDGQTLTTIPGIKEDVFVNKICSLDNEIWICTTNGIYVFDENFTSLNSGKPLFKQFNVSTIIKDKTNAYWISTLDNGLIYVNNMNVTKFADVAPSSITKINENTAIFGTTKNEGFEYNLNLNQVNNIFRFPYPNQIVDCYYDKENKMSFFSSNTLKIYRDRQLVWEKNNAVKCIKKLWDQTYFLAHSNGVCVMYTGNNPKANLPNWLKYKNDNIFYLLDNSSMRTKAVEYYPADSIFIIGNIKGLFFQDRKSKTEIQYLGKSILANSLLVDQQNLYIASGNLGMLVYNFEHKTVSSVSKEIPTQNFNQIRVFGPYLFFASDNVLYKYHLANKTIEQWNCDNGISKDEIKDFEVFEGRYVVCLNSGLISISDREFGIEKDVPKLYLDKIICSNTGKILDLNNLSVDFEENNLNVLFSIPWFKNLNSLEVFYRINGGAWIKLASSQRSLPLASLEPNTYAVELKAISYAGIESETLRFTLTVRPPFYRTWWFILLLTGLILFLIYQLFRYRSNQIRKKQAAILEKQELSRKLDLSTLKTLRAQMNPHFIYNSLNSIQSYVYSGQKELASKYLGLFSDLSRSLLDSSTLQEISLHDEIKLIDLYLQLECIRLPKIKYEIIKSPDLQEHNHFIPAMIVQPIVENAIKHGLANKEENCFLKISIHADEQQITIEIDDNGIGRKKAETLNKNKRNKPASFATDAIESRITLLNKNRSTSIIHSIIDKYDSHQTPIGTTVKLTIPTDYND